MTITLRQTKGSALTHAELDANFITLEDEIFASGVTWTSQTNPVDNNWKSVTYGNGLFVAIAQTGTGNRVMTSPDGVNWTIRTSAADVSWQSVAYGDGVFVVVANVGGTRVMTSYDGITWTLRTPPLSSSWSSIVYGNGLFVAVSSQSTTSGCMSSPDGITWTAQTLPVARAWNAVTYGNGLYVAVAETGTGDRVMTSPDAFTWTSRTSAADNDWNGVVYGNGLFVAVSSIDVDYGVMTSPDGINWTIRVTNLTTNWNDVTWGNGLFVAVGRDTDGSGPGTANVITSPDGITWTFRVGAAANTWNDIVYGNGLFVAISGDGTSNRVMTSGYQEVIVVDDVHRANGTLEILGNAVIGDITSPDGTLHVHTGSAGTITPHASADDLIVEHSGNGGISLLCPDASVGNIFFGTPSDNVGALIIWNYNDNALYLGTARTGGETVIRSGGAINAMFIASDQGAYMLGATGGSQGSGTFNATAVYDDGVLLTCYVPHYIVDGQINLKEWDEISPHEHHEPARRFNNDVENRVDVEKFTDFWKTNKHLPTMPSKEEWKEEGPQPTGKMIQMLWETVELQAAHIDQLLTRIEALEGAK